MEKQGLCQNAKFLFVSEDELKKIVGDVLTDERKRIEAEKNKANEVACLSRSEVASMLSVTYTTLWRWARDGYLKPKKVGRRVLYLRSDVEQIIMRGSDEKA